MQELGLEGVITHLNISKGGVPKLPIDRAAIGPLGLEGDVQRHTKVHGGPNRAVCLYSMDLIEQLNEEGHPIAPGTTGENMTIRGLDWSRITPGSTLTFSGGVVLEATSYAVPCHLIKSSFAEGAVRRIHDDDHPGESRIYTKVLTEGDAAVGESVILSPA